MWIEDPGTVVLGETEPGIITRGCRCRQQDKRTIRTELFPGLADQYPSDSRMLNAAVHGKIRKVAAVMEVCDGPRNADEQVPLPGGDQKIGVVQHPIYAAWVVDGPPFGKRRPSKNADELIGCNGPAYPVVDQGASLSVRCMASSPWAQPIYRSHQPGNWRPEVRGA